MESLMDQALTHQFPVHPNFEAETRTANLRKVYEVASQAAQTQDGRVPVDKTIRQVVRQIANPLQLGEMAETHFVIGQHWKTHFNRKANEAGGALTVSQLREWTDQPKPMGLLEEVSNLVIMVFAEQTNRSFYIHGAPCEVTITSLKNDMELREQVLPAKDQWEKAVECAGAIFGIPASKLPNVTNVSGLARQVKEKCIESLPSCRTLCRYLKEKMEAFEVDPEDASRMETANASLTLLEQISGTSSDNDVIEKLAEADVATSETAMGQSIASSLQLVQRIEATEWDVFNITGQDSDDEIREFRKKIAEALTADEHVIHLGAMMKEAQSGAIRILTRKREETEPQPPSETPKPLKPSKLRQVINQGEGNEMDLEGVKSLIEDLESRLRSGWKLRINLSWIIEEEDDR
jgi:hypothetical protein